MKKTMLASWSLIFVMALLYWVPGADGYETYDGCKGCHGDFRGSNYVSLVDGVTWSDNLHDIHRINMLGGDCDTCHLGSKSPVFLYKSDGMPGINDMACLSCHGRVEDIGAQGVGLRQHHQNAGEPDCLDCHDDSDPNNYTPVGEDVFPPFYVFQDVNFPNKPSNPCNPAPDYPEDYEGSTSTRYGLDNDGDGLYDEKDPDCASCIDIDGDGFSIEGENCGQIDCDDSNPSINPGAAEVCDGIDNNCDGNADEGFDYDGDGYTICEGDCNDNDATMNPGAAEICGNGFDENCDGVLESCPPVDNDGDGYTNDVDCNDSNPAINPGATEICENGVDENCDGVDDPCPAVDNDGDGYGDDIDCNDNDPAINPGASEICENGVDENCDGVDYACPAVDNDGDGYGDDIDCNDNDPAINPGAEDICSDGIDQDCNGTDRTKGKGCKTNTRTGKEGKGKTCSDGIDNDEDGLLDCQEPECSTNRACKG